MLKGISASKGYGIGKVVIIKDLNLDYSSIAFTDTETEKGKLNSAVEKFSSETKALIEDLKKTAGEKESQILEGHLLMLNDPFMLSQMEDNINKGMTAEASVDTVCKIFYDMFSGVDDEFTRQRATDVKDIKDSLLRILLNIETVDISKVPKDTVLVAKDFTPSMTSQINKENVAAIVTELGGVTGHSAILARAMGIPAVISVSNVTNIVKNEQLIIVDGSKGKIVLNPTNNDLNSYKKLQEEYNLEKESLNEYFAKQTKTKSGIVKKVYGNIGKPDDVQNVIQNGGEGIGLFRTEFLFMDRDTAPSEEEQFEAYSTVAKAMNGKDVIIRTLDIGGDKEIPYMNIKKEENPFLGHRAIRYCLDNQDLFKSQIRAILRAAQFGNIKFMLPLITTLEEVKKAKEVIEICKKELKEENLCYKDAPLGIMIETPSAAIISDLLAKEVDFFSIGTNDLTGYTMAVDRGNAAVSNLYDVTQISVLRLIEQIIKNAKNEGIEVGMCGEAASYEEMIPKLVNWGLDEFSVSHSSILITKKRICEIE